MAKSEKAAAAVETLFKRKPGAPIEDFMAAAESADSSTRGMSKRSFNATYMLPLKRGTGVGKRKARKKGRKAAAAATPRRATRRAGVRVAAGARESIRNLVLDRDKRVLATLRSGGDPKAAYELAAGIDEYIDRLAAALRG